MKNNVIKLGLLAMMVMGGMNAAHAGNELTVSGQVLNVTCDISVPPTLNSGVLKAKPADIDTAGKLFKSESVKVTLSGCQGAAEASSQGHIRISGPVSGMGDTYFNSETTSPVAIGVTADATGAGALLANRSTRDIGNKNDAPATLNNTEYDYSVGLASASATPAPGIANAVLKFEFSYN
ncbi:fimbrial protein [Lelliottia nimipressuralis]|uniref:fimbrial protein n=1 Tax=Lelliottia nimipressuralis TaxID=69220 RepID=UPI003555C610